MDEHTYCLNYLNKYVSCLLINIDIFGKERGPIMCDFIKDAINNSSCSSELNEYNINNKVFYDNVEELLRLMKSKSKSKSK